MDRRYRLIWGRKTKNQPHLHNLFFRFIVKNQAMPIHGVVLRKGHMFKPIQDKRLHQQVFEQIQAMILNGQLQPGDRLPSERDLGELLQVSRNSVREALRALEVLGIIECRHGGGNYIKIDVNAGLIEPLTLMFKLHGGSFTDLLVVRRSLETEAAALAAERITAEQSAELAQLLEATRANVSEAENIRLDKAFHLKIADISGNVLLLTFLTAISTLLERSIKDGRQAIMHTFRDHDQLLTMHENIYQAISSHHREAAIAAVKNHFQLIIDNLPTP